MCLIRVDKGNCFSARNRVLMEGGNPIVSVCSNSGLAGGGTNRRGVYTNPERQLQEESCMREIFDARGKQFVETQIFGRWGFNNVGTSISTRTLQGIDYTDEQSFNHANYRTVFKTVKAGSTTFVFVAGPNANIKDGTPTGSRQRTACRVVHGDYNLFVRCIEQALCGFLSECVAHPNAVPIIAGLSTGVYAGPHTRVKREFAQIARRVIETFEFNGRPFSTYFAEVVIATNESAAPMQSTVQRVPNGAVCKYGEGCYRTNQAHVNEYHQGVHPSMHNGRRRFEEKVRPHGDRSYTTAAPMQSAAQRMFNGAVCKYGDGCYQTNTEHVATFHQGRSPASRVIVRASPVARCPYGDSCLHVLSWNMGHIETQHPDIYLWLCKNPNKNLTSYLGF